MGNTLRALALVILPAVAHADRPRTLLHPVNLPHGSVSSTVNTHILYLNNCMPNGCSVKSGTTDARSGISDIVTSGTHTVGAYSYGTTSWASVVACVKSVMAPFNITVTDVDPGAGVDRFEVMIGGSPSDIGQPSGVGGIADYPCGSPGQCEPYIPNALVFDFADVYGSGADGVTFTCGTAAQEIAHAWTLDHATGTSDPMTYNNYTTPLHYRDAAPCGSDCDYSCPGGTGSCNAFGVSCSGSGTSGTHTCMGSALGTQDEVKTITALFGGSTPDTTPPTVAITSPANGASVQTGFTVTATVTDDTAVQKAVLEIDGTVIGTLAEAPWSWTAPSSVGQGAHHVVVTGYDLANNMATASIDVTNGAACSKDSDCTASNEVCLDQHCVPGPGSPGGLGTTCTSDTDCMSGQCASDGTSKYCVNTCDPTMPNQCPSNFGCLTSNAGGVCWPGADSGGTGGCNTSGGGGPIAFGLGFAALIARRRRRPAR